MRVEDLGMKVWSQSKLCTAILRMLLFVEAKVHIDIDEEEAILSEAIAEMRNNTRALLAKAKREADRLVKERPSVDELREQGKLLSFIELVKQWRVDVLVKNYNRTKQTQQVIGKMLPNETLRLAVISMLLKVPLRKGEFEACTVDMTTTPWRLKLSAEDRKSGQPINNSLSRKEMELFQFLLKARQPQDEDDSLKITWRPFEGRNTTDILKATTRDIAGVQMTIMDLRTAAESYVDLVGKEDVQNALSFAEGHTERVAKQYYKRNGSTTMMRPWTDHIEGLIHGHGNSSDNDNFNSELDNEIDKRMELSQQEWRKKIEMEVCDLADQKRVPIAKRKARQDWSEEEDKELRRLVRIFGRGSWKDILDSSPLLQKRYQTAPTVQNARECLKTRWRVLSRSLENTDNHSGVKRHADGKVIVAIHRRKKRKVADESTSKSMSNKSFAHSEQLHTREKEWECITSRSRDADGNTRYEGNSLSHEEADKDPKPRVKKERKTWDYRYNELLDFKNKYGHCDVPQKYSPLGKFVANQREYYKAFLQGQPCALTEEKVDLLNSIDFTWKVDRSRLRHRRSVDTAGSGTKDCTSKQGAIDSAA
eukprot:scaffold7006_cov174-Skeletonema_marinoi.AAC.19